MFGSEVITGGGLGEYVAECAVGALALGQGEPTLIDFSMETETMTAGTGCALAH